MPYGRPGGAWAVLRNGQVELRHTKIDIDAAVEQVVRDSGYPGRREWAEEYIRSAHSDAEALTLLRPAMAGSSSPRVQGPSSAQTGCR